MERIYYAPVPNPGDEDDVARSFEMQRTLIEERVRVVRLMLDKAGIEVDGYLDADEQMERITEFLKQHEAANNNKKPSSGPSI